MNKKNNKTVLTYNGRLLAGRPVAGQKRYVAAKRTHFDGRVWWCIFDHAAQDYLVGKYKTRNACEIDLKMKLRHGMLRIAPSDYIEEDGGKDDHFKKGKHLFAVDVH